MTTFDLAFKIVIGEEGGYVNNPKDPGGETKYGVSKRSYPSLDIKNLSIDQAKKIYKENYWDKVGGDSKPFEIALPLFDCAINCGTGKATELYKKAVAVGGGPDNILAEFMTQQIMFKIGLKIWKTFGLGWARREFRICIQAVRGGS